MTSSILPPRRFFTPCSPMTQANASTTFDFPEPFGPMTEVIPGSNSKVVFEANDLKPRIVRVLRYMQDSELNTVSDLVRHQIRATAPPHPVVGQWLKLCERLPFHRHMG